MKVDNGVNMQIDFMTWHWFLLWKIRLLKLTILGNYWITIYLFANLAHLNMNLDYFLMMTQAILAFYRKMQLYLKYIMHFSDVENSNKNVFLSFHSSKVIVENNFFKFYSGYSASCILVCDPPKQCYKS